jgi:hypothetical protein
MDSKRTTTIIDTFLKHIRDRLERALFVAKAAETCSQAGNADAGIEIALQIESLVYEANTLLNAASLIRRLENESN